MVSIQSNCYSSRTISLCPSHFILLPLSLSLSLPLSVIPLSSMSLPSFLPSFLPFVTFCLLIYHSDSQSFFSWHSPLLLAISYLLTFCLSESLAEITRLSTYCKLMPQPEWLFLISNTLLCTQKYNTSLHTLGKQHLSKDVRFTIRFKYIAHTST